MDVIGLTTLGNASTTQISASSNIYTALTANSIPYIGTSGLLTQDNSNFVWDSTNNRLGIGTSSPYARLSVAGETVAEYFTATSTTATTTFSGGVSFGKDLAFTNTVTSSVTMTNGLKFDSGTFVIDPNSNRVGIGTTSPTAVLEVYDATTPTLRISASISSGSADPTLEFYGGTVSGGKIYYDNGTRNIYVGATYNNSSTEGNLLFYTGGFTSSNPILTLEAQSGAGVGIWETTPDALFEVSADGGANDLFMLSSDDANDGDLFIVKNSGFVGIGTTSPSTLTDFYTTATTTITIDSSAATQGGCLKIKNATTTGYIYCISNGGGLECSTTSCE